jgi:DNA-binding NtrC family response regulator
MRSSVFRNTLEFLNRNLFAAFASFTCIDRQDSFKSMGMANQKRGRLLIIDDEAELREVLIALLEDYTQEIVQACNGMEGMDILSSQNFDAVLSDEKMPKKSGLEVLKWMREKGMATPFIIHSGFRHKDMVSEASRLGAFAFIDKPWDENKLIQTVCDAIDTGLAKKS